MDHLHEIAEILLHPRVYRFLHIPIQVGDRERGRGDGCVIGIFLVGSSLIKGVVIGYEVLVKLGQLNRIILEKWTIPVNRRIDDSAAAQ